ncbi:MAG TPA: hypothetical protein VMT57_03450 [Candidatus Thermoplasmatota archaeon]|nr:hypothetical protein [Candidatus Thermoplasmatota archaeon]
MTTTMNQNPIKEIPITDEKIPTHTKKALKLIVPLVLCGVVVGLLLSYFFVNEANDQIIRGPGIYFRVNPLTTEEIILPAVGVVAVCISMFLLIGLIAVYIRVFVKTGSKYIAGLLFFLAPLFVQSILSINTLRSLFISAAIPDQFQPIRESIGFGIGGFGEILVIISLFEIIGLSILLYLSTE